MKLSTYMLFTILLALGALAYGWYQGRMDRGDQDVEVVGASGVIKKYVQRIPRGADLKTQRDFYKKAFDSKGSYKHICRNDWIYITRSDGYTEEKHAIQVAQKGNWKLYVGLTGLGIITGAIIMYKF